VERQFGKKYAWLHVKLRQLARPVLHFPGSLLRETD
jgi:hypothetical protein